MRHPGAPGQPAGALDSSGRSSSTSQPSVVDTDGGAPSAAAVTSSGSSQRVVDLIGRYGHRLLPEYRFAPTSGHWRHARAPAQPPRRVADLEAGVTDVPGPATTQQPAARVPDGALTAGYLTHACAVFGAAPDTVDEAPPGLPPAFEQLRDYHLPAACLS
jgi:hypothetical protein